MAVIFLLVFQTAVMAVGFFYLWRRQQRLTDEIAQLRQQLSASAVRTAVNRKGGRVQAAVISTAPAVAAPASAWARAARAWGLTQERVDEAARSILPPSTARALILGVMAAAPAIGFFFAVETSLLVAAGLGIAAAMMFAALRPSWRAAAWAGTLTAAAWALMGFVLAAGHVEPIGYALCVSFAAAAGLAHARLRPAAPGATLALAMSATALALSSQIGMIGPAGAAFALIVAMAALVGASSLRLESIHLSAFGASLIGLFVLSGQPSAAIWFTPAAAMAGALFLAIAAVRVPQLGANGAALAGVGVLAPLGIIAALHDAQHGLSNAYAAGGAYLALAAALSGILALAAQRRPEGGLAALKLTHWMLALGAFAAASAAAYVALPAPLAAPAMGAIALAFAALDMRWPARVWRTCAILAVPLAAYQAWASGALVLSEALGWDAWLRIASGGALAAALLAGAAWIANRNKTRLAAGVLEAGALVVATGAAHVAIRYVAAAGAPLLNPISFVEAAAHISLWLVASLLLGVRADYGASAFRRFAASLLGILALLGCSIAAFMWLTPFWTARTPVDADLAALRVDSAGFALPAALLWAHWVLWRARRADNHTRIALGGAAFMTAAFATFVALRIDDAPNWLGPTAALFSFALAVGINFASGVTAPALPKPSHLEKDFERDGLGEQSSEAG